MEKDFLTRLKTKLQQKITNDVRGSHTFQNRYKPNKTNVNYNKNIYLNHKNMVFPKRIPISNEQNDSPIPKKLTLANTMEEIILPLDLAPTDVINTQEMEEPSIIVPQNLKELRDDDSEDSCEEIEPDIKIKDEPNSDIEEVAIEEPLSNSLNKRPAKRKINGIESSNSKNHCLTKQIKKKNCRLHK